MDRLKGKVAIITGAAGGICHKASELFCQEGAKGVMVFRRISTNRSFSYTMPTGSFGEQLSVSSPNVLFVHRRKR